jgi:two-component system sensor histidine kinase HydH
VQKLTSDGPIVLTEHPLPSRAARAHALKNSLGVVSAVNCLIRSELTDVGRERVERSQEAVRRMLSLIEDDLSPNGMAETNADAFICTQELAKAVIKRVRDRVEASRVALLVQTGAGAVVGDAPALVEAIGNFVLNAIEATPPGGAVRMATHEATDRTLLWTIHDTGPGVAPDFVEHLGTPFASRREGGTGLGIAVAHDVIARHGGCIRIESGAGSGTLVSIQLPARSGERPR